MNTSIISVTDFIRKFGDFADLLPKIDKLILTRDGRPFAEVRIVPEERNKKLLSYSGIWKNTELDDNKFWNMALKRNSRKKPITI